MGGRRLPTKAAFLPPFPSLPPFLTPQQRQTNNTLSFLLFNLAWKVFHSIFGVCVGEKGKIVLCMIVCLQAVIPEGS